MVTVVSEARKCFAAACDPYRFNTFVKSSGIGRARPLTPHGMQRPRDVVQIGAPQSEHVRCSTTHAARMSLTSPAPLDIMRVPGIIVARTDAESATFLDNRSDERDQPSVDCVREHPAIDAGDDHRHQGDRAQHPDRER